MHVYLQDSDFISFGSEAELAVDFNLYKNGIILLRLPSVAHCCVLFVSVLLWVDALHPLSSWVSIPWSTQTITLSSVLSIMRVGASFPIWRPSPFEDSEKDTRRGKFENFSWVELGANSYSHCLKTHNGGILRIFGEEESRSRDLSTEMSQIGCTFAFVCGHHLEKPVTCGL